MTAVVNLYGAPGSGKTRKLLSYFLGLVERGVEPERIGVVTFTRTAAEELRGRIALSLGIRLSGSKLRQRLPSIGTIHALALRASEVDPSNVVTGKHIRDFCDDEKLAAIGDGEAHDDESPYVPVPMTGARDMEIVRYLLSAAKHRIIALDDALPLVPQNVQRGILPDRLLALAYRFEQWKQDQGLIDFEDMLYRALGASAPPVRALLADECQDNSPLLWRVIDHWAPAMEYLVTAGDPFQSIFQFSGADPSLFINRKGRWKTIGDSHRFGPKTAEACAEILAPVFGRESDEKLAQWRGVGGQPKDGTTLYLARTNKLLTDFTDMFLQEGIPFKHMRRAGPLQRASGDAWRLLRKLQRGEDVAVTQLGTLWQQSTGQAVPARFNREGLVGAETAERILGHALEWHERNLLHADYFSTMEERFGPEALYREPQVTVSTIHGAKGREADHVVLCNSWAYLPYRSLMTDPAAERAECCVAYVSCSRHRVSLEIVPGSYGYPYRLPFDYIEEQHNGVVDGRDM